MTPLHTELNQGARLRELQQQEAAYVVKFNRTRLTMWQRAAMDIREVIDSFVWLSDDYVPQT